ncbi:glycosyltransferase family 2 protein [bacterium]|nr:glycosyltransferase family 2 protein [candidate division CSSED10-310 bacterium]
MKASKKQTQSNISVVIPAALARKVFANCLHALFTGTYLPKEVILVDDAMDEVAYRIARNYPITIVKNRHKGVSAARNFGARYATGSIILFIDTDVILPKNGLEILEELFRNTTVQGAVGILSRHIRYRNFASKYKNHWMRFTYQRLDENIHLFYTSCAAIRKEIFLASGGFDTHYRTPSIEDTVFGAMLGNQGIRIVPIPQLEVDHVKRYSLWTVLTTDLNRSSALVKYILRSKLGEASERIRKTSVPGRFIFAALFTSISLVTLLLSPFLGIPALVVFAAGLLMAMIMNRPWIHYLQSEEGFAFASKSCVFIPLDVTFVVIGMVTGALGYLLGSKY